MDRKWGLLFLGTSVLHYMGTVVAVLFAALFLSMSPAGPPLWLSVLAISLGFPASLLVMWAASWNQGGILEATGFGGLLVLMGANSVLWGIGVASLLRWKRVPPSGAPQAAGKM